MRASAPRKRGTTGGRWFRRDLDLAGAGRLMREAGFVACDKDPVEAYGHLDRQGRLRRAHARYESGWRATLTLRLDGDFSLSQSIRLVGVAPAAELKELPR